MIPETRPEAGCANEGCTRRAEPGEEYCSVCCLEWNLFRREERRLEAADSAMPARRAAERR